MAITINQFKSFNSLVEVQFIIGNPNEERDGTNLTTTVSPNGRISITGTVIRCSQKNVFGDEQGNSFIGHQLSIAFANDSATLKELLDAVKSLRIQQLMQGDNNPFIHIAMNTTRLSLVAGVVDGEERVSIVLNEADINWKGDISVTRGEALFEVISEEQTARGLAGNYERRQIAYNTRGQFDPTNIPLSNEAAKTKNPAGRKKQLT